MIAIIVAVFAIIADQVSKYFVVQNIELYGERPFIPNIMSLYHTQNTGAAFSMFSDKRWVFMVFSVISMGVIVYLLIRERRRHILLSVSLAMVLGGGIGNMIDRILLGYVVDFFKLEFVDFAIFNVADCFITVGAVLLGVYVVFFEPKVEKKLQAEKAAKEAESQPETVTEPITAIPETPEQQKESHAEEGNENG